MAAAGALAYHRRVRVCIRCHQNLDARAEWCPDCGAEMPARGWPDDPLVGASVLGRYRIERRIGAGGMGVVYRAVDRAGDAFALKALRGTLEDDEATRRFRREARSAALLRSPAAVRVFESGALEDGTLYFVMELVDGRPLNALLRDGGPLPVADAMRLLDDLSAVLVEAHALGLVHRDLKPDNLLVVDAPEGPRLKVLDFGIVKVLDPAIGTVGGTVTGKVFGTPEYMSPEQARGLPEVDARSDVFSAGLCAFVMLTGRLPFSGRTPQEVMLNRLHTRAPRVSTLRPTVPAALDTIIDRMLEPAPADRPASMAAARAALRAAAPAPVSASDTLPAVPPALAAADTVPAPAAPSAPPTTPAPRSSGPLPRWLGAGAAFLLVMVALAWLFAR